MLRILLCSLLNTANQIVVVVYTSPKIPFGYKLSYNVLNNLDIAEDVANIKTFKKGIEIIARKQKVTKFFSVSV